ncbi:MAG: patatin-like phospholipase family protein [Candidatus Acidiferrales bacterium]
MDGGGMKGVFAATFLASIEEILNINVGDYFDLIVGTSTGAVAGDWIETSFLRYD